MILKYLVFLSLILSAFSEIISSTCEISSGRQINVYTCSTTEITLEWIVDGIPNTVRFLSGGILNDTDILQGDIFATLDSRVPLMSRLTIPSNSSLATADVVCRTSTDNRVSYIRDDYRPVVSVNAIILEPTMDSKCVMIAGLNVRYVTLNLEPVSSTEVEGFSITNSQNDKLMRMQSNENNVTIALLPDTVTFNITTMYKCLSTSGQVQFRTMKILASDECITTLIFLWPGLDVLIYIVLISVISVFSTWCWCWCKCCPCGQGKRTKVDNKTSGRESSAINKTSGRESSAIQLKEGSQGEKKV